MALKGSLETLSITSVFQFIAGKGGTGSVWISDAARELYIYFERGNIRLIATGRDENYRLDAYLIKNLRALPKNVHDCINMGRRIGKRPELALTEAGLASQEDLEMSVRLWIEEQLFEIADWKTGQFKFMPDYRPHAKTDELQEKCDIHIPVNDVLLTLARRQSEWQSLQERFPDNNVIFEITSISSEDLGSCTVPAAWLAEAELFDGSRTIAEIISETILTRFELFQLLSELRYRGLVANAEKEKLIERGEEARREGDITGVIKYFKNALSTDPHDTATRVRFAEILRNMNVAQEAFEQYQYLGDYYSRKHEPEKAMQHYRSAMSLRPDSTEILQRIGDLHELAGNLEKALKVRARIGNMYRKAGRYRDAAYVYGYLSEKHPGETRWCLMAASCFGELDMPDEATEFYEKAISIAMNANRKDEVQEILNAAMKQFAGNPVLERRLLKSVRKHTAKFKQRKNGKAGPEKDQPEN